jgi:hypothetical protein
MSNRSSNVAADVRLSEAAGAPTSLVTSAAAEKSRLWLWFVAAFLIQAAAWTTWFVIASQHKVAEVPLVNSGRR